MLGWGTGWLRKPPGKDGARRSSPCPVPPADEVDSEPDDDEVTVVGAVAEEVEGDIEVGVAVTVVGVAVKGEPAPLGTTRGGF